MQEFFGQVIKIHKQFWNRETFRLLMQSFVWLGMALVIEHFANNYVDGLKSAPVGDLILSNTRTFDVDFIIIQGALIVLFLIVLLILLKPKYISFVAKSVAMFVFIRSLFITLTHLGAYPNQIQFSLDSFGFGLYNLIFYSKNDFFFSGHTGLPFLMALIFWQEKFWRRIFFIITGAMGTSVLLAHLHYSIDVFAAPFITFSIFTLSKYLFKKDFDLIRPN